MISRDEIKEGYVSTFGLSHKQLPPETNGVVSNFFFATVNQYLAARVSVVVEAAFQHQVWETRMAQIVELSVPILVRCSIDAEIAAQRHLQRGLDHPEREFYHGDSRVTLYKQTGTIAPPDSYIAPNFKVPTIHVATEIGYSPNLKEIAKKIFYFASE